MTNSFATHCLVRLISLQIKEILLENKTLEEWIWNYDYKPTWKGKTFIHGHLTCNRVTFKSKGININTKCGYGGVLTGLYFNNKIGIDEHTIFSISEDGEELKRKKSIDQTYVKEKTQIVGTTNASRDLRLCVELGLIEKEGDKTKTIYRIIN